MEAGRVVTPTVEGPTGKGEDSPRKSSGCRAYDGEVGSKYLLPVRVTLPRPPTQQSMGPELAGSGLGRADVSHLALSVLREQYIVP